MIAKRPAPQPTRCSSHEDRMAPKRSSVAPAKPQGSGLETVSKCLLQLRTSTLKSGRTPKAFREALQAAEAFEACLAPLEAGRPALQLVLAQTSLSDAKKLREDCKQLSQDVARFLSMLKSEAIPNAAMWPFLRPVLRLLLWLLPEHVPLGAAQSMSSQALPAEHTSSESQTVGTSQAGHKSGTSADVDWRQGFGQDFVKDIATPFLANAVLPAILMRASWIHDFQSPEPTAENARTLEECLVLLTLASRVAVLGCEMETTRGTSEGASASKRSMKPRDEAETLASCCRQQLAMSGLDLWKLADVVIAWLQGCGLKAATESRCYSVRGLLPGAFMGRDEAIYEAFASWFKPSSELVNAVGLWRAPAVISNDISSFLISQLPEMIPGIELKFNAGELLANYKFRCMASSHGALLTWLLPTCCSPDGSAMLEYARRLPPMIQLHLKGLIFTLRAAVGHGSEHDLRWKLNLAYPAAAVTADLIWKNIASALAVLDHELSFMDHLLVPDDYRGSASSLPLFSLLEDHDRDLRVWKRDRRQQQQRQQQQQEGQQQQEVQQEQAQQEEGQQRPGQPQGQEEQHQQEEDVAEWMGAAVSAAEALRFLFQILHLSVLHEAEERQLMYSELGRAALALMQWLRPSHPEEFTSTCPYSRGWVQCFSGITAWLSKEYAGSNWDDGEPADAADLEVESVAVRVLLEELLPVLYHVADLAAAQGCGIYISNTQGSTRNALAQAGGQLNAAAAAAARSRGGAEASSSTTSTLPPQVSAPWSLAATQVPIDSILLLLASAAEAVAYGTGLALSSQEACMVMCRGLDGDDNGSPARHTDVQGSAAPQHGTNEGDPGFQGTNDLAAAARAAVLVAVPLVNGGPWWQEAKARHPLVLTEVLFRAQQALSQVVAMAAANLCHKPCQDLRDVWSSITTSPLPPQVVPATQPPAFFTLNPASIVVELTRQLWALLGDSDISGSAPNPASWLPERDEMVSGSARALTSMATSTEVALDKFLQSLSSNPTEEQRKQAARQAMQLAALVPTVPGLYLKEALLQLYNIDSNEHVIPATILELQTHLCVMLPLRAICALAITGCLTEQQRHGLVVMLGGGVGVGTSSGASNQPAASLVLEPPNLASYRETEGISLMHMSVCLFWYETQLLAEPLKQLRVITKHMSRAFGAEQLPVVPHLQQMAAAHAKKAVTDPFLLPGPWRQSSVRDTYLGWVQASLLKVISDVLGQQQL